MLKNGWLKKMVLRDLCSKLSKNASLALILPFSATCVLRRIDIGDKLSFSGVTRIFILLNLLFQKEMTKQETQLIPPGIHQNFD